MKGEQKSMKLGPGTRKQCRNAGKQSRNGKGDGTKMLQNNRERDVGVFLKVGN